VSLKLIQKRDEGEKKETVSSGNKNISRHQRPGGITKEEGKCREEHNRVGELERIEKLSGGREHQGEKW